MNHFDILSELTSYDHINYIPYEGKDVTVKIIDVYDGDTCTCVYCFHNELLKTSIRLAGVDTPELTIRGKDDMDENELNLALLHERAGEIVGDYVRDTINGLILKAHFIKAGKYGKRVIAELYVPVKVGNNDQIENVSLSDILLEKDYANPYDGKRKKKWTESKLNKIIKVES
jgi:endonuclease YncB( thermonuclease family)